MLGKQRGSPVLRTGQVIANTYALAIVVISTAAMVDAFTVVVIAPLMARKMWMLLFERMPV